MPSKPSGSWICWFSSTWKSAILRMTWEINKTSLWLIVFFSLWLIIFNCIPVIYIFVSVSPPSLAALMLGSVASATRPSYGLNIPAGFQMLPWVATMWAIINKYYLVCTSWIAANQYNQGRIEPRSGERACNILDSEYLLLLKLEVTPINCRRREKRVVTNDETTAPPTPKSF